MTLSEDTFSGILFRSIPLFIATLRKLYDYVIIDMAGMKEHSVLSDKHGNEVVHAFLQESNSVYYVCSQEPTQTQFLNVLTQEHEAVTKIVLGEKSSSIYFPVDFTLPWNDQIISHFKREASPYLTGPRSEWTYRAMNRLARFIAKMQVGIAMGSGAAYGYTLIGMLKVFEREKIPLDFISGTSMGALIGSFYASGKSAEELTEIAHAISKVWIRHNALNDLNLPWPHGGFLKGTTISRFLKSVLGEKQFSDLQIPFACVATDIMTGDQVILREGKVWEAVRASLSLPIVFCPYKLGNRFLVDGGLVNPVPTSVIALMGADILISVNLTSRVSEKKVTSRLLGMFPASSPGMSNILFKMIYTMQYKIASSKTDLSHIVITPDTRNFVWTDFHKAKQIIPLGEEAAEENLTKIKSRLPFFADYCRVNLRRRY
jgi:NTE family protein